ncbi:hypothetical protein, partial [Burkholderia sp. Bp8998]|uniref:hypothetical protein n=1 Tax=Burkholderia sp. Bp8998 TaxID=2184557 RepID=UPI001C8ABD6A
MRDDLNCSVCAKIRINGRDFFGGQQCCSDFQETHSGRRGNAVPSEIPLPPIECSWLIEWVSGGLKNQVQRLANPAAANSIAIASSGV